MCGEGGGEGGWGVIPLWLIPFVVLDKLLLHNYSACKVKSTSKYLLKQSDTLQTHYRHIEHVQEEI